VSVLALVCLAIGCGSSASNPDGGPADAPGLDAIGPDAFVDGDIADTLAAIYGMKVIEEPSQVPGYRYFTLYYDQPVDHRNPGGQRFRQQMTLLHRDNNAPMVMVTTGYHNFYGDYVLELTELLGANQLVLEHRHFGESKPDPIAWEHLTIKQSADDQHRIIQVLSPLYPAAWLTTGVSKGGMTAVYHRRFYPDDVDGTVPYVAPVSFGAPDSRYLSFFDDVGEGDCAQRFRDFQRDALMRRPALEQMAAAYVAGNGETYEIAGSVESAFESGVAGMQWSFWQYMGDAYCAQIPTTSATDAEVFEFLKIRGIAPSSDQQLLAFQPYYVQTMTQLGFPETSRAHVADLIQYQFAGSYLPEGVELDYDPAPMHDISQWVVQNGERLLFIYGQWDPWTAGAFRLGSGSDDSFVLTVPRGTHAAEILDLPTNDRAIALDAIERWTGVTPQVSKRLRRRRPAPFVVPPMVP
jgi:hypothetical protein